MVHQKRYHQQQSQQQQHGQNRHYYASKSNVRAKDAYPRVVYAYCKTPGHLISSCRKKNCCYGAFSAGDNMLIGSQPNSSRLVDRETEINELTRCSNHSPKLVQLWITFLRDRGAVQSSLSRKSLSITRDTYRGANCRN
jgi:hypothetical protein